MYDTIYDPDKQTGVLVDPDNGRALGPILAGPKDVVVKLFDSFIGGLGADPTSIHPADLDHHFRGFLEVLAEEEEAAPTPAGSAPASSPTAPAGEAPAAAPTADAPAEPRPTETAAPGETGGLAGPPVGSEVAPAGATGASGAAVAGAPADASGVPADGGLPTAIEEARPGSEGVPGAEATPAGTQGGGIPKAPGA